MINARPTLPLAVAVLVAAVGCTSADPVERASVNDTVGTSQTAPRIDEERRLAGGDACGDVFFWATSESDDLAVTVEVDVRQRSNDEPSIVPIAADDPNVTIEILHGENLSTGFCTDLPGLNSDPSATSSATAGHGEIVVAPAGGCGTEGSLQLEGLVAADGTAFAPIEVNAHSIGCYSG